jgi:hypothetical protein
MKMFKTQNIMSVQSAILLSGIIISASIFLTTWVFFGGDGNRQKLFTETPSSQRATPPPSLSPEQIKKIQEQRAAQNTKPAPATTTESE